MSDTIRGTVIEVIDGCTFVIKVTFADPRNNKSYQDTETVIVINSGAPEFTDPTGTVSAISLEGKVFQREVSCRVRTRDSEGHLVAQVSIVS